MIRYWLEFNLENYEEAPPGFIIGCGVTGYNYEDVVSILFNKVFTTGKMPSIVKTYENVMLDQLDQGHVIPNMSAPNRRGIWFPLGYRD